MVTSLPVLQECLPESCRILQYCRPGYYRPGHTVDPGSGPGAHHPHLHCQQHQHGEEHKAGQGHVYQGSAAGHAGTHREVLQVPEPEQLGEHGGDPVLAEHVRGQAGPEYRSLDCSRIFLIEKDTKRKKFGT